MLLEFYWQYFAAGLVIFLVYKVAVGTFKEMKTSYPRKTTLLEKALDDQLTDSEPDDERKQEDEVELPALPSDLKHIPFEFCRISAQESLARSRTFYEVMKKRRTVRHFSTENFPREIIYNIIRIAGTSPSGAHTEPWVYVLVSSPAMKEEIRDIVEREEEINYKKRMSRTWTTDLKPLRTNWVKEYLTDAPYLILVFKQLYSFRKDGTKKMHYYSEQSVNLAAGMLLAAIQYVGLVSLTSTPLNCGPTIRNILRRPSNEKLMLLLPVGYPARNCLVPDLHRKPLEEIMVEFS